MYITPATPSLAGSMLAIYTPFITDGAVTFETIPPSLEDFKKRIETYTTTHPWLVMMDDNEVAGYAYASPHRERLAYQWVTECSVYMHPSYKQKGIARSLYKTLFHILRMQGFYKVYAGITLPNDESIGFHEKMGFEWFATYKEVGYKAGHWQDVGWWELKLQQTSTQAPQPPVPFSQLQHTALNPVLAQYINVKGYDRDKPEEPAPGNPWHG